MPFFSIIIPTYNSEKDIAVCCSSITRQSFRDFEIVIQDAGSTDNTLQIIEDIEVKHPSIPFHVVSEKDFGIYDAMNRAVQRASGEWLIFLGSDDSLYDNQVLKEAYDQLVNVAGGLVYGNAKLAAGTGWAAHDTIYDGPFSLAKLFEKNICHQAIFYHKNVFEELGFFNPRYKVCADWDFNFRCFAGTTVRYIDLVIANFGGGGVSSTSADAFREESVVNLRNYFKISYFNPLFKTYSWVFLHHAITAYKEKAWLKACHYLLLSFYHADRKVLLLKIVISKLFGFGKQQKH